MSRNAVVFSRGGVSHARTRLHYAAAAWAAMMVAAPGIIPEPAIAQAPGAASRSAGETADVFCLAGERSILEEAHCGIVNGRLTAGVPFKDVGRIEGLWSPPYVSSDFQLAVRALGQPVPADRYTWRPFALKRGGVLRGLQISSRFLLVPGRRAGLLVVEIANAASEPRDVPLEVRVSGTLDRTETWEFAAPTSTSRVQVLGEQGRLVLQQGPSCIVLEAAAAPLQWDPAGARATATVSVPPRGRGSLKLAIAIGEKSEAVADCRAICLDPDAAAREAESHYAAQVHDLFAKLPRLEAENASLVRFYERSLVHLLMNRWDVPDFVLRPYYSTGSVRGGCVCNYLWNFGETWELLPLYDPAAVRAHVNQFLRLDLTRHFAFNPITGRAFGPWYMVNQEKIIGLVYYYVKNTGDASFLREEVGAKTVLDHVVAHALYGDDTAKPVALIDYGPSNSHLELRRGYPYHHTMPDLNGRRYASYLMAARLAELAGRPMPELGSRAEALRLLLKQRLWNRETRWFDFLDGQGARQTRYTIQMFKLFGSGVLDAEQEAGLLGHLHGREFLSEFGLHSLAKTDPAYDQVDIDNGGGGSCSSFPPQIAERLYKSGHPEAAEAILRRILWWGERMPYWGDSMVANAVDYRKDTPLQCTIDGVAGAQCLLFGTFGVEARLDGSIRVRPQPGALARRSALRGLRLRGKVLDIVVRDGIFEVTAGGQTIKAKLGEVVVVKDGLLSVVAAALPPAGRVGSLPAARVLFLGNSITVHPPLPGIGWSGNWGMAASAEARDYVHLVTANIARATGAQPETKVRNIADFERQHDTFDVAAGMRAELDFNADIVIVAIGENVPALGSDAARAKYAAAFARLLAELKQHGQPAIFVRSCFWPDPAKDEVMRQASADAGATFIDIGPLGRDESNAARSERRIEHAGVAGHPGDKGMQAIADALWAAIQQRAARPAPAGWPERLIGYTELQTNLPGGRHANVRTMRATVVGADGTGRRHVAADLASEPDAWTQFAGWSPDGKTAVIARGWQSPENAKWEEEHRTFRFTKESWLLDSYLVDLATATATNVTAVERVSFYNGGLFFWPNDPTKLGFTALIDGNSHPFRMDRDGRSKVDLTKESKEFAYGFSSSPDGRRIAYHKGYQVFLADADGANAVCVQTGQPFNFAPTWSPDGQRVLFLSGEHYSCHPHIVAADGKGLKKLADRGGYRGVIEFLDVDDFHGGSSDTPVWSADGKSVLYTAQAGSSVEVFQVSLDGQREQLTHGAEATLHYHPQPSRDGKWLLFGSRRGGVRQLYVMRLSDRSERCITRLAPGKAAMWPHWQPVEGPAERTQRKSGPT